MFNRKVSRTTWQAAQEVGAVIYHMTVRNARGGRGHAGLALVNQVMFMVLLIILLGLVMTYGFQMRRNLIRGDFILFLMTGIFMFRMHVQTIRQFGINEGAGAFKHTQASAPVQMAASALSTLYSQMLSILCVLGIYYAVVVPWGTGYPFEIVHPIGALWMIILSWLTAICVGLLLAAVGPWAPRPVAIFRMLYIRVQFIASGKMFLGNDMPGASLKYFEWNPLFHIIDQARGYTFMNYFPRNSNIVYPLKFCLVVIVLGLMIEFVTRRSVSASWSKSRF